jgi:hypothetical protein
MQIVVVTHRVTGESFRCYRGTTHKIEATVLAARGARDWDDPRCRPLIDAWDEAVRELR